MILVKAGGGAGLNWEGLAADIAETRRERPVVLVHGANALRDRLAARLGVEVRIVVSPSGIESVYTDEESLDVFLMAYAGLANKKAVALLQRHGINAVGLCGVDGRLWEATAKKLLYVQDNGKTKLIQNNLTGRVENVNAGLVRLLLDHDFLPVLCAPAITPGHEIVNTDNDTAAAVLAQALGVRTMIFLFEAPGFLKDVGDPASLVPFIAKSEIDAYLPSARGRMQKKMLGAKTALEAGVGEIRFADGRIEHPLREALGGRGTIIR